MQNLTLSLGILLIILGAASYLGTGQESVTALIPSFFGILFVLFGWLGKKESLVEIIGDGEVERPLATIARSAMFIMCVGFLIRSVQSFIAARKKA